ncbi:zf-HC2 domain-containing protein [Treponema sp. HNW]|uniref:hypothetical protein n=1 Tax=Treponema sp. HNW TaxID=3116654 RepID=UPI003D11E4BF
MSTCPAKDIHCLYADNELQEPFKTEFEIHTASCDRCRRILSKYRTLRKRVSDDSDLPAFLQDRPSLSELDEGYKRLKARLSYKKVVLPEQPFIRTFSAKMIPAAAAAVFVFTAVLALRTGNGGRTQNQVTIPASMSSVRAEPIQKRGIVAPENVSASSLASMFGTRYQFTLDTPQLTAIDVFKPELSTNVHNVNHIRIPLATVSQMPLISAVRTKEPFDFTEVSFR